MSCTEIHIDDIKSGDLLMVTEMIAASKGPAGARTSWMIVHDSKGNNAYTIELLDSLGLLALRGAGMFAFNSSQTIALLEGKHRNACLERIRRIRKLQNPEPKKTQWAKTSSPVVKAPAQPGKARRKQQVLLRKLAERLR